MESWKLTRNTQKWQKSLKVKNQKPGEICVYGLELVIFLVSIWSNSQEKKESFHLLAHQLMTPNWGHNSVQAGHECIIWLVNRLDSVKQLGIVTFNITLPQQEQLVWLRSVYPWISEYSDCSQKFNSVSSCCVHSNEGTCYWMCLRNHEQTSSRARKGILWLFPQWN